MKNKIFLIVFLFCGTIHAQEKDMQTWITFDVTAPLNKKLEVNIENEMRFVNNTSLFGRNQTEFLFTYTFNKKISAGIGYRVAINYPFSEYTFYTHRWFSDFIWKTRIKRFRLNTRFRLQNDQEVFWIEEPGSIVHRERLRLGYKIRKTPYLIYGGVETYFRITHTPFELRKIRLNVGTRIDISKNSRISVDLLHDKEYNRRRPATNYILQLGYSYNIGRLISE